MNEWVRIDEGKWTDGWMKVWMKDWMRERLVV